MINRSFTDVCSSTGKSEPLRKIVEVVNIFNRLRLRAEYSSNDYLAHLLFSHDVILFGSRTLQDVHAVVWDKHDSFSQCLYLSILEKKRKSGCRNTSDVLHTTPSPCGPIQYRRLLGTDQQQWADSVTRSLVEESDAILVASLPKLLNTPLLLLAQVPELDLNYSLALDRFVLYTLSRADERGIMLAAYDSAALYHQRIKDHDPIRGYNLPGFVFGVHGEHWFAEKMLQHSLAADPTNLPSIHFFSYLSFTILEQHDRGIPLQH